MEVERTPEETEALVLSALTTTERISYALRSGLTVEMFRLDVHREAWTRAVDAVQAGRPVPAAEDLRQAGVAAVDGVDDYETYLHELLREAAAGHAYAVLQRFVPALRGNPQETTREIIAGLSEGLQHRKRHEVWTDRDARDRLSFLRQQRETALDGGAVGIPTGLALFDDAQRFWTPGDIGTIYGYSGVGKSWVLVYMCCVAYLAGRRILFLTPEETARSIGWRQDVVLARLDEEAGGGPWTFTHSQLVTNTGDLENYAAWVEKQGQSENWVTIDAGAEGVLSVDEVVAKAREYRPDVLAINGFHLLNLGKGREQSWETIFESGARIKGLAQDLETVVLTVTQARRSAGITADEPPDPYDVAYGHAIVEVSDRLISLGRVKGNRLMRRFKVPKFREGPDTQTREHLHFDVDRGYIRQVAKERED